MGLIANCFQPFFLLHEPEKYEQLGSIVKRILLTHEQYMTNIGIVLSKETIMFFKRSKNRNIKKIADKAKILIIDDEPAIVLSLQDRLKVNDYEVVTAGNGVEGLQIAVQEKPDVILLDVIMPIMDGQEMLEALRKQPDGYFSSVIMLTAQNQTYDFARANVYGIDDYIVKPFDLSELLEKIEVVVEGRKSVAR